MAQVIVPVLQAQAHAAGDDAMALFCVMDDGMSGASFGASLSDDEKRARAEAAARISVLMASTKGDQPPSPSQSPQAHDHCDTCVVASVATPSNILALPIWQVAASHADALPEAPLVTKSGQRLNGVRAPPKA